MKASRSAAAILLVFGQVQVSGAAPRMITLKGHVLRQVRAAARLERVNAQEMIPLSLSVHLDQGLLDQTLEDLYGRNATDKKHFLSAAEFAQKFGLADKRQALKDFARASGFFIDPAEDNPNSMAVKVHGAANLVEKAFGIQLNRYRAADGQVFRGHETDPIVPENVAFVLGGVAGLSNYTGVQHPHLQMKPASSARSAPAVTGATGPTGALAPADVKTIYGLNGTSLTGAGQTVAVFELDGFNPSDITAYQAAFSLPNTPVTFIGVDGTTNLCGGAACGGAPGTGQVEVTLDIEMVMALASGVTRILDYDGPNTGLGILDTYDRIATDDLAKAVSSSWGGPELQSTVFDTLESQIFQRMAAQGQSFYVASGDSGAFDDGSTVSVDDPASQPFATAVGGTSLAGSSVASPIEVAWNSCGTGPCLQTSGGSSGGGVSSVWTIPSYQVGVAGTASTTARNVPDVSLNADPSAGYEIFVGGGFLVGGIGGTSAAAPLWAAFTSLINQASTVAGTGVLGFANPTLYRLGSNASTYAANFNDVISGDNGNFSAHAGYDNVTGLGSYKGGALINSLTGILALLAQEQLMNVFAFPNPWDTRKYAIRQVTISNLPDDATVKLFTLSGFWVKNLTPSNGRAIWDLTNDSGDRVASGLYFYVVKTSAATTKGTIAIIK